MDLNEHLQELVAIALSHPPQSLARRKYLTQIIRLIGNSGKLWWERSPHYEDALQKTWQHLCENLDKYDPNRASLITWLNQFLRWRITDGYREDVKERERREKYERHCIDIIPEDSERLQESIRRIKKWVLEDKNQILSKIHVREHPEVNCQTLILRKLEPQGTWKNLSREFQMSDKTLIGFYKKKCIPELRKFTDLDDLF